jgi:hypothetical protein
VLDFDQDSAGDVRLIMMYIDGVDLDDLIDSGPLPIPVIEYIVTSVLSGLAYIHKRGILHRDITLGNILVSRSGGVWIADFGLATWIEQGNLAAIRSGGTVGFMSPEALKNDSLDARSDLFSLGAVLYQLLTTKAAFPATNTMQRMAQTLCQTPPPAHEICPQVPEELSNITARLLAPNRDDRFASALEVLDALPVSKYGSEDLAALIEERHQQKRLRLPSMQHERASGKSDERNGADSSDELARRATMPHPRLEFDPRPRIDVEVWRQALAEHDAVPRWVSRDDAEIPLKSEKAPGEANKAPRPPDGLSPAPPRRRVHPWLAAYLAVIAIAAIAVWGTLGWRALRSHQHTPQEQAQRQIEAMEQPENATDHHVSPGPAEVVEPTPSPQPLPIVSSDEMNSKDLPTRGKEKHRTHSRERLARADRPAAAIARKATEEATELMDTPQSQGGASSINDPTVINPFEQFAGPMGETLPGEVVMQP